jgi:hypothetical protein
MVGSGNLRPANSAIPPTSASMARSETDASCAVAISNSRIDLTNGGNDVTHALPHRAESSVTFLCVCPASFPGKVLALLSGAPSNGRHACGEANHLNGFGLTGPSCPNPEVVNGE